MVKKAIVSIVLVLSVVLFSNCSYAEEEGLVGYWKFDETEEEIARDFSGNGNDGTIIGAVVTTGKIGQALSFNGVSDKVTIAGLSEEIVNSFSVWVKPITSSGTKCIARLGGSGNIYYIGNTGKVSYQAGGLGGKNPITYVNGKSPTSPTLTLDVWNHLVVTFDDYTLGTVYLASDGGKAFTQESLDEVRIYNRVLTATEVEKLYKREKE